MADHQDRWPEVSRAIEARMKALAWQQVDLMRVAKISQPTAQGLMNGEPGARRPATLRRVSVALDWPPDTIERILAGERPPTEPVSATSATDVAKELADVRQALADVEARLARVERSNPPPPAKAHGQARASRRAR